MAFDSVLDLVKDLLFECGGNCSNQTFVRLYYKKYDLGMLTPCESITRARRFWVKRAKLAYTNGVRELWVLRLIPSQDRLIESATMENKFKEAFSCSTFVEGEDKK